ncbi:MAG: hypothetical protein K8R31_05275 [Bacteroidales bacterium]|nr:hypothetical protein [Bacteroidales bacterium]
MTDTLFIGRLPFLVVGNYKIIYWIEDNYIKIATIFDCRQNPEKFKKV